LNHRCVAGLRPEDEAMLRHGLDRVSIDDARAAVEWLAGLYPAQPFDRKRIVALGRGFGGYLAVRALQLEPATFRCGIAMNAPLDLPTWLRASAPASMAAPQRVAPEIPLHLLDAKSPQATKFSALEECATLKHPLLLLVQPAHNPIIDASTSELRARLQQHGRTADYAELDADFAAGHPKSRAVVYRRIEEFLHVNLNDYAVRIGPAKEVD
jgi:dipeptidyl aminopeptidase/acylaminoacyl peptidase